MKFDKLKSPQQWMLPLLLIGFIGSTVTFLSPIFNSTTRWAILIIVLIYLLVRGQLLRPLKSKFGHACILLIIWCSLTTTWSELPVLSGFKSGAFLIITLTSLACGMLWVKMHEPNEALDYLIPLTYITIFAGVLGKISDNAIVQLNETVQLYQGAVGGSNMFGSMLAMCAPLLIWKVYISNGRTRKYWLILLGTALFYLLASKARSSFLSVLCTLMFFYMGYNIRNKILIFLVFTFSAITMYYFVPEFVNKIENNYINKHHTEEGLLYSRNSEFEESYKQALKGGWIGGGYGVTIGDAKFTLGLSVSTYGREKTNSQLAIVEETGIVGLAFYAVVVILLLSKLQRGVLTRKMGPSRLQLLLVIGTVIGMIVKSVFEAWWVAPGSPESVYFWTLVGIALGLCSDQRTQIQARSIPNFSVAPTSHLY